MLIIHPKIDRQSVSYTQDISVWISLEHGGVWILAPSQNYVFLTQVMAICARQQHLNGYHIFPAQYHLPIYYKCITMIFCSTDRKTYCRRPQVATVKKESLTSVLFASKLVESLINANKISSESFFRKIFVKCSTPVAVGSSTFFGSLLLKYVEFFMIKSKTHLLMCL